LSGKNPAMPVIAPGNLVAKNSSKSCLGKKIKKTVVKFLEFS
jgi:hypothetical protein